jgi:hypothetical protein
MLLPGDKFLARAYHVLFASTRKGLTSDLKQSGNFFLKPGEKGGEFFAGDEARRKGEEFGEVVTEAGLHFAEGDVAGEELFKRCGFPLGDTAGNDEIEKA